MRNLFYLIGIILLTFSFSSTAMEPLGMVTGSPTGTYYAFGNDIKTTARQKGIEIAVKESRGSIDNIGRISSAENAAFGIVQSDVLGYLLRANNPETRAMGENLRMVFPFYQEEVHVLGNKSIRSFDELNNRTVAVGLEGSGSWLTAMNLFNIMGIRPAKLLRLDPPKALVSVLTGEADAMIFVGGKPVKLFQNLTSLKELNDEDYAALAKKVHFISLHDKRMLSEYSPTTIKPEDYDFVGRPVPTIAVTALLVSYDFSDPNDPYTVARCTELASLSNALRARLPHLQKEGHPKWKEVYLDAEVGSWKRDACSRTQTVTTKLEDALLSTLEDSKSSR